MVAATTMEVDMDQRATPGMASVMVQSFRSVTDMQDVFESPQRIGSNASSYGSVKVVGAARSLVSSVRNSDGSVREDAKEIQPEDGQRDYHGPARISPWWSVSFNVLAEIMGTGILSLPSTVAGLGYILGSLSILIFAFAVYYQGFLLQKVKNKYYKHVLSYGDIAFVLHGSIFETFVRYLLYANWYALLCYYILALTSALMSSFYLRAVCFYTWGLIAIAVLLPFAQLRTFHAMSYVSILSFLAILGAVGIIAASFITGENTEEDFVPPSIAVPSQSFLVGYTNIANIIFSFQGQSEFVEMMAEMKDPKQFPLALLVAQVIMLVMYLFTSLLSYTYGGQGVHGFVLYSLPENRLRTAAAMLIAFHIVVAYIVMGQPLTYKLHEFFSPKTLHAKGAKPALVHLGVTSGILILGYLVANLIPFFSDMQGVISAFAASFVVFAFPAYFYVQAARKANDWGEVPWYEKAYLGFIIFVVFPICFFVGLASSISAIASGWNGAGKPFACLVASQL